MALQASFPFSSSCSSFSYAWPYDVFLSFRGGDTRLGFTGNLYKALKDKGIHTFFDDEKLQRGKEITPSLVKAIQDSRIAIVVFSVNYASSSFCLEELATIMESIKGMGRLVLPVFYDVDPCDVRHQRGSYGEAMAKHEERFKDDKEKVRKWRETLQQAANLSGEDFKLKKEYEYVFIEKIVKEISNRISRVPLHIADYPVGLESQVLGVNSLLNNGVDGGVLMVGIYGIGGIGKTTLARALYNFIADQFEGVCFLENVREESIKRGLVNLQKRVLSQMLGDKHIMLGSVNQGIPIIKHRLHRKKILLVLDDVDKLEQLRAIVGGVDWFGSGSRVIITTRDQHLLANHKIEKKYEVKRLSEKEALLLLRWNAFKYEKVDPSYMDILKQAVTYACGLPLALEVIGSNLSDKSIDEWRSALYQYEKIPDKDIQKKLRISYDALGEYQQKIFLDIACCFKGYLWEEVQGILYARHDYHLEYGIAVLVQKSLIKINECGIVTLHDLIQDMGREIVRQESLKHPGKRSRLWHPKDVVQVLEYNTGTSDIEIIILESPTFEKVAVEWGGEAFKKMRNLEILIVRYACFSQGVKHLPNSLKVLEWWNYPSNSLPSNFHPKELAIFKLPNNSLMSVGFVEKRKFMNLKVLNLDKSKIKQIPDVSGVPNLEELSFYGCRNLIEVHESIGFLNKLRCLIASRCSKLKSFPALMLPSLKRLDLSWCQRLENFPEILGHMEGVKQICWSRTSIKELPSSIINLRNLTNLTMDVPGILRLPISIVTLPYLIGLEVSSSGGLQLPKQDEDEGQGSSMVSTNVKYVIFRHCNMLDESVPIVLALFCNVVKLDLSGNDFTFLPESIKELCSLRELTLNDCKKLREIRAIPPNIKMFIAANCTSLTPLCRSKLLNEELHGSTGCKRFHLPGSSIPKWFEHSSRDSISFWFRNKPPSISVCAVSRSDGCYGNRCTWPKMIINGYEYYSFLPYSHVADHITIVEVQMKYEHEDEQLAENEWNHVEYRVACNCNGCPLMKEFGVHVNKQSNMKDIRFTESHGDLSSITLIQGSADFPKDKGKDLMVYNHVSEQNSMHSWGQELLDKNWESSSVKLASSSGTIREGSCHDNLCTLSLSLEYDAKELSCHAPSEVDFDSDAIMASFVSDATSYADSRRASRKRKESTLMLELKKEPGSETFCHAPINVDFNSDSVSRFASDIASEEGSCHDSLCTLRFSLDYDAKELSYHAPSKVDFDSDGITSSFTSNAASDAGSADLSKDKGKDLLVYNDHSSDQNSMHSCEQELLDKSWESISRKFASTSDIIQEGSCYGHLYTMRWGLDSNAMDLSCHAPSKADSGSDSIMSCLASHAATDGGCGELARKRKRSTLQLGEWLLPTGRSRPVCSSRSRVWKRLRPKKRKLDQISNQLDIGSKVESVMTQK